MGKEEYYKEILKKLFVNHLHETIELYSRDEDVSELEKVLSDIGISSNVLEKYMV